VAQHVSKLSNLAGVKIKRDMALIRCPECNSQVSRQAEYCPKCAHLLKANYRLLSWLKNLLKLFAGLILLVIVGWFLLVFGAMAIWKLIN